MKKLLFILSLLIATSSYGQLIFDTHSYDGELVSSEQVPHLLAYIKKDNVIIVKEFLDNGEFIDKTELRVISSLSKEETIRYTVKTIEGDSFEIIFFTPTKEISALVAYEFEDVYILIYGNVIY
jgi:hypothetical protein